MPRIEHREQERRIVSGEPIGSRLTWITVFCSAATGVLGVSVATSRSHDMSPPLRTLFGSSVYRLGGAQPG